MTLLLDTHFAFWLAVRPYRLTPAERRSIDSDRTVASAVSLWELRIKWQILDALGVRKGPADPVEVHENLTLAGIDVVPLTPAQALTCLAQPIEHKDPFDEMLLIQAQEMGATLLTRDRRLRDHPLAWQP